MSDAGSTWGNTAFGEPAFNNLGHDFLVGAGVTLGVAGGIFLGPEILAVSPAVLTAYLSNPEGFNSFGLGFIDGFSETSGIGTTGLPPSNGYDAAGEFVGEIVGSFFDFQ